MSLTFSAQSLRPAKAATTLTGYRTNASFCLVAAALHVDLAEDRPDPQLIPLLAEVMERSAEAAPGNSPADLLRGMHEEALRTGRYYSGIAICGYGSAIVLAQSGLVSVHGMTSAPRQITKPDIMSGQTAPILTSALGTRQFRAPDVITLDPRERLAVFVGASPTGDQPDSLRGLPAAMQDPVSRGGLVIFVHQEPAS